MDEWEKAYEAIEKAQVKACRRFGVLILSNLLDRTEADYNAWDMLSLVESIKQEVRDGVWDDA